MRDVDVGSVPDLGVETKAMNFSKGWPIRTKATSARDTVAYFQSDGCNKRCHTCWIILQLLSIVVAVFFESRFCHLTWAINSPDV